MESSNNTLSINGTVGFLDEIQTLSNEALLRLVIELKHDNVRKESEIKRCEENFRKQLGDYEKEIIEVKMKLAESAMNLEEFRQEVIKERVKSKILNGEESPSPTKLRTITTFDESRLIITEETNNLINDLAQFDRIDKKISSQDESSQELDGKLILKKQSSSTGPATKFDNKELNLTKLNVVLRNFSRSPSVILLSLDSNYYDNSKLLQDQNEMKLWEKEILPFTSDKSCREKILEKVKPIIFKFIPSKFRCKIWPLMIGNTLKIKKKIYDNLITLMEKNPIDPKMSHLIIYSLEEDLKRTYPKLKSFNRGEILNQELQTLLELYHFYRPDIGYVQGMAYPAAILILHFDPYHAFKFFVNLIIARQFLVTIYKCKMNKLEMYFNAFEYFLKEKAPLALKHLQQFNITPDIYLVEWFFTLFSRNFHINTVTKIWDLFLMHGELILIRTAVAIFQIIEPVLIQKTFDETLYVIRSCGLEIESDLLFKYIRESKITYERLLKFLEKEVKTTQKTLQSKLMTSK